MGEDVKMNVEITKMTRKIGDMIRHDIEGMPAKALDAYWMNLGVEIGFSIDFVPGELDKTLDKLREGFLEELYSQGVM